MPAFIAAGSLALGAFGASREAKRQKRLAALAAKQKKEAQQRGQENIARYRGTMASPVRMARLALGTTGGIAKLRTSGLEADVRQKRLAEREMRDQVGGSGGASGLASADDASFQRYLQTEGFIGGEKQKAQGAYTGLVSTLASTTAQMQQSYDVEQTALGSNLLGMQASQADPWGAFASGVGASLGSMAGQSMGSTATDKAGNKTQTSGNLGDALAQSGQTLSSMGEGIGNVTDWLMKLFGSSTESADTQKKNVGGIS